MSAASYDQGQKTGPMISLRRVCKVYSNGVVALRDITLAIDRGEFVAIVGPSGSGKSTLLHVIGALDRPSSGDVIANGQCLHGLPTPNLFRLRTVGFVFQFHHLIPTLTAVENVEVPLIPLRLPRRARRARALGLLEKLGVADRAKHYPAQLSGGESQRVAVARALANDPPIILADEPTGELDSRMGGIVVDVLAGLNKEGKTVVVVTHNQSVAHAAQRVILLRDGMVVENDIQENR